MGDERETAEEGGAGQLAVELADMATRLAVAIPEGRGEGGPRGARIRRARFEQPPAPDAVIERVGELAQELGASTPRGVSVAVWGRVDQTGGVIAEARFGAAWEGYPLVERLSAKMGAPVRLASGVNAAARAEALRGAASGRSPLLYVHLGRTISSALALAGEPLVGAQEDAGRLGHWQTGLHDLRCVCGAQGHLEPLASAQSLVRLAIGVAADDDDALAAIHRVTGGRAEALKATQVVALARDGVRPLRELVDLAVEALAGALANLAVTLDPAIIVIGGPLALGDAVFIDWLREQVARRLVGVRAAPEIAPAALEPNGALLGGF